MSTEHLGAQSPGKTCSAFDGIEQTTALLVHLWGQVKSGNGPTLTQSKLTIRYNPGADICSSLWDSLSS